MKIFLYAVILITFFGCETNDVSQPTKTKTSKPKKIKAQTFTVNRKTFKIFTGSDGHSYYEQVFFNTEVRYFHYPGCEWYHF